MVVRDHNFHLHQNRPEAMPTNYDADAHTNMVPRKRPTGLLVNQGMIDTKKILHQLMEKSNIEIVELSRQQIARLYAAVENFVSEKMKIKDGEIKQIAKLNKHLEKKLNVLANEVQLWRDYAHSNATEANILRAKLEQIWGNNIIANNNLMIQCIDDAESCCSGDEIDEENVQRKLNVCRSCGDKVSSVLLLPCRHLCLCDSCVDDPMAVSCPVCGDEREGIFEVKLV